MDINDVLSLKPSSSSSPSFNANQLQNNINNNKTNNGNNNKTISTKLINSNQNENKTQKNNFTSLLPPFSSLQIQLSENTYPLNSLKPLVYNNHSHSNHSNDHHNNNNDLNNEIKSLVNRIKESKENIDILNVKIVETIRNIQKKNILLDKYKEVIKSIIDESSSDDDDHFDRSRSRSRSSSPSVSSTCNNQVFSPIRSRTPSISPPRYNNSQVSPNNNNQNNYNSIPINSNVSLISLNVTNNNDNSLPFNKTNNKNINKFKDNNNNQTSLPINNIKIDSNNKTNLNFVMYNNETTNHELLTQKGRKYLVWLEEDNQLFYSQYKLYSNNWKLYDIPNKTKQQIQSHGQYLIKANKVKPPNQIKKK